MKKLIYIMVTILTVTSFLLISVNSTTTCTDKLSIDNTCKGVVNKKPGEHFTVEITFKNTGGTEGTWSVNICFEGDWIWKGNAQTLTLAPNKKKTLTWNGNVPQDAPIGSVARLVVYFDNDYKALDWWIIIVSDAQLSIIQSRVK